MWFAPAFQKIYFPLKISDFRRTNRKWKSWGLPAVVRERWQHISPVFCRWPYCPFYLSEMSGALSPAPPRSCCQMRCSRFAALCAHTHPVVTLHLQEGGEGKAKQERGAVIRSQNNPSDCGGFPQDLLNTTSTIRKWAVLPSEKQLLKRPCLVLHRNDTVSKAQTKRILRKKASK